MTAIRALTVGVKTARERVLDALVAGPKTDAEIEQATGLKHQSASARRNELVKSFEVCDSGQRRLNGSAKAAVWQVHRDAGCSCGGSYSLRSLHGTLGAFQLRVYEVILKAGPMTGEELDRACSSSSAHKRLSELQNIGMIRTGKARPCQISGKLAKVWCAIPGATPKASKEVSGQLPVPTPLLSVPQRPSAEELGEAADELWKLGLAALTAAKFPTVLSALKKRGLRPEDLTIGEALRKTILWVRFESGEQVENVITLREPK